MENALGYLKGRLEKKHFERIEKIRNAKVFEFLAEYVELCNPANVYVCTDSEEDLEYARKKAIENREEAQLKIKKHTVHFDNYLDQGRDKEGTKFLLPKSIDLGPEINSIERNAGLEEIHGILKGIMAGREMYVKFFCLGPLDSEFSSPAMQLTDSSYVAHNEDLLYRQGYKQFLKLKENGEFFKFVHSQGELKESGLGLLVSKNIEKRRMYMDLEDNTIYSTNTQYGGNTIGLKKLAMRLAIRKASKEGWLTEHMLLMGIHGPKNRITYFSGAFPSMCGKTSTAMLEDETIVGDDIAYIRNVNGKAKAVNVEKGMFGIIDGINAKDDPLQWKTLRSDKEVIFSNVLVSEGNPYWNDMGIKIPEKGINYSGDWILGKKDEKGKEILASHRNARFTFSLDILENADNKLHDPEGVELSGIIYGGRDSDTWVPVNEAIDWEQGIILYGASIESETTAATLGSEGLRAFNPMSNLDFLSIPIGRYIQDNLNFGKGLKKKPKIFSVNYFLKDKEGKWLNHKNDKHVWLKWMELRVHNEIKAIKTPIGLLPKYEDLKKLFKEVLGKDYSKEDYEKQFSVRIKENLAKIDRIEEIYKTRVKDAPEELFTILKEQGKRLEEAKEKFGEYISPEKFKEYC